MLDVHLLILFLVPMLQRGNAYHTGSHAGAWEPDLVGWVECSETQHFKIAQPNLRMRQRLWTPVFTGVTTFYEFIKLEYVILAPNT